MIDFHSHILPAVDDGADDITTALKMLKRAKRDGIDTVVSTSHAYIGDESDIDRFLERRNSAYDELQKAMMADGGDFPEIRLGAELHLKAYMGKYDSVARLAIQGTDYILLEMPYSGWNQDLYEAIYNIQLMGLKPIMAHIERYMRFRSEFHNLKALEVLFQVNADSFTHKRMRKTLLELFYGGYIHILGSDMHNLDERKNKLKEACEILCEKFGQGFVDFAASNAVSILEGKKIEDGELPKLSFLNKLKL
ncbi:MAG: CpsB/CapC family capsule biosynthesis tyrosine phosphatase [Clostridia bacterium]|nr:CpsB/CapC family capsule biosynthesis tyrosine phosphatase [Clostridia bacterium]